MSATNVQVWALQQLCNPFQDSCWIGLTKPITKIEIQKAISEGKIQNPDDCNQDTKKTYKRSEHISRIAYFVENGWRKAISIDVGIPSMGCHVDWPVDDGNHRLAAAIF